jgi:hypothetical protein
MEEEARKLDLRPLLVVAGVVAVVLTMWAAGAFAAGGSSSPTDSTGNTPSFIQNEEEGQQPRTREDCPEGRGGDRGGQEGAPEGTPDGSGSPSL